MISDIRNLIPSRQPEFRFRLNGEIMPEIFIQRPLVDGEPVGEWQIVVDIDGIGKVTLDDAVQRGVFPPVKSTAGIDMHGSQCVN